MNKRQPNLAFCVLIGKCYDLREIVEHGPMKKHLSTHEKLHKTIMAGRFPSDDSVERQARVNESREGSRKIRLENLRRDAKNALIHGDFIGHVSPGVYATVAGIVDRVDEIGLEVLMFNLTAKIMDDRYQSLIDRLEEIMGRPVTVEFIKGVEAVIKNRLRAHFEPICNKHKTLIVLNRKALRFLSL